MKHLLSPISLIIKSTDDTKKMIIFRNTWVWMCLTGQERRRSSTKSIRPRRWRAACRWPVRWIALCGCGHKQMLRYQDAGCDSHGKSPSAWMPLALIRPAEHQHRDVCGSRWTILLRRDKSTVDGWRRTATGTPCYRSTILWSGTWPVALLHRRHGR